MSIATILENFLSSRGIAYELLSHAPTESLEQAAEQVGVPLANFARAIVLTVDGRPSMVVLPLDRVLNFERLAQLLGDQPQPVPVDRLATTFSDCEPGCVPAVGEAYGLPTLYDEALLDMEPVVMEGGSHGSLVQICREDLRRLTRTAHIGSFSRPVPTVAADGLRGSCCGAGRASAGTGAIHSLTPGAEVKDRVERVYELPMMPDHARQILELRSDPEASSADLARVVGLDPSLAAQVMRYARSPLFGYSGNINTLQEAISRVLGFDMVLNLALGLAALKPFRNPPDGPLGLHAFWRHATCSAALAQRLGRSMAAAWAPQPGLLYLAGLLHNFGFLVFGHLFQPEFYLLNKMVAANPRVPVTTLERQVLCMGQARDVLCLGHAEVGAWLMKTWRMPDEVVVAAREHHNPDYEGVHANYANLVLVVDRVLRSRDIGDGDHGDLPPAVLERLGLAPEAVESMAAETLGRTGIIEEIIGQWVA